MAVTSMVRTACGLLPPEPGVYRFTDAAGRVLYVGRATDLRSRTRSYWGDLRERRHLRRMVGQIVGVEAVVCASLHEASWLERNLLERSLPRWNRTRGGQEVPCWLVLDDGPRRPGLVLVWSEPDAPAFGPYLGATAAKLAWSGLVRACPLHLTGTHLDATDRSLAEARGVAPRDREAFGGVLRSLLSGDSDAAARVRSALTEAREAAAERLAFETASRIQAELAALDWLIAPQRVTGCTPADLAVHGWSDGVLFSLTASDGRLDRWSVTAVDADAAASKLHRTPPQWRDFAARNAELASALRRALGPR